MINDSNNKKKCNLYVNCSNADITYFRQAQYPNESMVLLNVQCSVCSVQCAVFAVCILHACSLCTRNRQTQNTIYEILSRFRSFYDLFGEHSFSLLAYYIWQKFLYSLWFHCQTGDCKIGSNYFFMLFFGRFFFFFLLFSQNGTIPTCMNMDNGYICIYICMLCAVCYYMPGHV